MNVLFQLLEHPLTNDVGWVLVHSMWIGAVATLIGAGTIMMIPSRRAAARHNVLVATLLAILPTAILWHATSRPSQAPTSGQPSVSREVASAQPAVIVNNSAVEAASTEDGSWAAPRNETPRDEVKIESMVDRTRVPSQRTAWASWTTVVEPWIPAIVLGWLTGICLITIRTSIGWRRTRRQLLTGRVLPSQHVLQMAERVRRALGIRGAVQVFESLTAPIPASIGFLRPLVILPASLLTQLSALEIEALLAHELAHVRRADFLLNLFQVAVETVLFFHPAVWWLGSHIRSEREHACDDVAVRVAKDRVSYATALTEAAAHAKRHATTMAMAASGGQSAHARPFTTRIRRILADDAMPARFQPWGALLLLAVLAALLVPLASNDGPLKRSPAPRTELVADEVDEDEATPLVAGVVLTDGGTPIAGASVRLSRTPVPHLTRFDTLAQTRTDGDGRFSMEGVEFPIVSGQPIPLRLIVTSNKYGVHWETIEKPQRDMKISLRPQALFSGQLLLAGKPVSNADIRVLHVMSIEALKDIDIASGSFPSRHQAYLDLDSSGVPIETRSDADGKFALDQIPSEVGFAFEVSHPSVARQVYFGSTSAEQIDDIRAGHWVLPPSDRSAEDIIRQRPYATMTPVHRSQSTVALTRGVTCRVLVLDERTKDPIPNLRLEVRGNGLSYHKPIRRLVTDAEGWCEIPQLRHGSQISVVNAPFRYADLDRTKFTNGTQRAYLPTVLRINVQAEARQDYQVAHVRGAILLGKVIDARDGTAISDVQLRYTTAAEDEDHQPYFGSAMSSKDGRYLIVVPTGDGELTCGSAPRGFEVDRKQVLAKPNMKAGVIFEQDIRLSRMPAMIFVFKDPNGRPVNVNAEFRAYSSSSSYSNYPISTNGEGKFNGATAIRGGATVKRIQFIARSVDGKLGAYVFEEDVDALKKKETNVQMRPMASVRGVLVDKDTEKPIRNGSVHLSVQYDAVSGQGVAALNSDDQGRFEFKDLVPGMMYSLGAGAEGYHPKNSIKTKFLAEPSNSHSINIALTPKAASRSKMAAELSVLKAPSVEGLSGDQALSRLLSAYRQADKQYRADLKEGKFKLEDIVDRREPRQVFVPAMVELGKRHAGTSVELKAFLWACRQSLTAGTMDRYTKPRGDAAAALVEKYADSSELSPHAATVIYASPDRLAAATRLMKSTQRVTRAQATAVAANIFAMQYDDPRTGGQEKLRKRAIELLETVIADYSDVKVAGTTLGGEAQDRLYDLTKLMVGAVAPDIIGQDLDGQPMKLSDFRGKVVVIHHWEGKLHDFAKMERLAERRRSKPLVIVGLNTNAAAAKAKAAMGKSAFRSWHDPNRQIMRKWGNGIPNTQVIGHDGKLLFKGQRRSYGSVEDAVDAALDRLTEK